MTRFGTLMRFQFVLLLLAGASMALPQTSTQETTFAGQPGTLLSNDKLQVVILSQGGAIASVVLADDSEKLNPMWAGGRGGGTFTGIIGHFVAVDGFGQPSNEERAAGLPQHGEAHTIKMNVSTAKEAGASSLTVTGTMPIVQENFTRTFRMVQGENVMYVDSVLENLMGFDRPVTWAEHATIQAPFVKPGAASVGLSGSRSQTRPYAEAAARGGGRGGANRRLASGVDFTWPMAPGTDGKLIDMTAFPDNPPVGDHTATLLDPSRDIQWAAAINTEKGLIYGYLFRREDYPWIQMWGNYPSIDGMVKGLEFGTQPYDINKSTVVDAGFMWNTPTWRWLRAKGKLETHFLMYFTRIPAGFKKIDDVRLENKQIIIEDKTAQKRITLAASRGL